MLIVKYIVYRYLHSSIYFYRDIVMLTRKIATICILIATLLVLTLYSATSRAENLPTQFSNNHAVVEISHIDFCNLELSDIKSSEPGCCDPGGSCFEKQCCSHGHASSSSLVSLHCLLI